MKWQFDPSHTSVEASAKHMMFTTVRVRFPGTTGAIDLDPDRPERATVSLSIPVAALSSGDEKRDGHLRSADFFDAEKHAQITFTSTDVERVRDGAFTVKGDLTIRGTTKPVSLDVTLHGIVDDPMAPTRKRAFVDVRAKIDRRDWSLTWNMPVPQGVLVSHDIGLEISAQVTSEAAVQQAA